MCGPVLKKQPQHSHGCTCYLSLKTYTHLEHTIFMLVVTATVIIIIIIISQNGHFYRIPLEWWSKVLTLSNTHWHTTFTMLTSMPLLATPAVPWNPKEWHSLVLGVYHGGEDSYSKNQLDPVSYFSTISVTTAQLQTFRCLQQKYWRHPAHMVRDHRCTNWKGGSKAQTST